MWLGLFAFELDLLQDAGLFGQIGGAGRELVDAEHEREDVGVLLAAQAARRVLRHRDPNALEEIADRQPVPARDELAAGQAGRHLTAGQFGAMTRRACGRVQGLAAVRLLLRIHAVPDRLGGRLRVQRGMEHENRRKRNNCRHCDLALHGPSLETDRNTLAIVTGPGSRFPARTDNERPRWPLVILDPFSFSLTLEP